MRKIMIILAVIACTACKKGKAPAPTAPPAAPGKVTLLAPATNSTCTVGRVLSSTESAVTLTWNNAANTDSYEITLKNLLSGITITRTTATTQLEINLLRNTPYSWYIVSKSAKSTAGSQSDTWKFYNAGAAASNYAPFPSELLLPGRDQAVNAVAGKIVLDWNGADVDNDITGYDVYLGTSPASQAVLKSNLAETILADVSVISATTYYWKVVAKDGKGNTSSSETGSFRVN